MSDHDLVAGALVDEPERSCQPCTSCGVACAKTDDGECCECSTELGEAGA